MSESLSYIIKEANDVLINNGNLDRVKEFFTTDYTVHLTNRDVKGGHNTVQRILDDLRQSFPDIKVEVDIFLESKERISWQRTLKATHKDKFKSFPASNKEIVWRDMVTSQFHDGLISEEWVITDLAEQLLLSRKNK